MVLPIGEHKRDRPQQILFYYYINKDLWLMILYFKS